MPTKTTVYAECYGAFEHRDGRWQFVYHPSPPVNGKRVWPVRIPVPDELVGEILTAKVG